MDLMTENSSRDANPQIEKRPLESMGRDGVPTPSVPNLASRTLVLCVAFLALFALNLFVLQPWLAERGALPASQVVYLVVRVVGFVSLAYLLVRWAGRNRYQTLSTVMLVGAIEQVVFKYFSVKAMMEKDPAQFGGMLPDSTLFYGLGTGFLFFAPILLILGFLGVELNRLPRDWKRKSS